MWAVDLPDPTQPNERRLAVIKSNLARFPSPLGFAVDEAGLHFGTAPEPPRTETLLDKAIDLLRALPQSGPVPQEHIELEAKGLGISMRTVERAKAKLRVVSKKPIGKEGWYWGLPAPRDSE